MEISLRILGKSEGFQALMSLSYCAWFRLLLMFVVLLRSVFSKRTFLESSLGINDGATVGSLPMT